MLPPGYSYTPHFSYKRCDSWCAPLFMYSVLMWVLNYININVQIASRRLKRPSKVAHKMSLYTIEIASMDKIFFEVCILP